MRNDVTILVYMSVILFLLFPMVVIIVWYYAEPGFPWHSYVTLVMGFYAAFAILLLVPIDIAIIQRDRSSTDLGSDPQYSYDMHTLSDAYDTFFTMVIIFGSFVLIFEEYYNTDGKCFYLFVLIILSLLFSFYQRLFFIEWEIGLIFQAHVYRYCWSNDSGLYHSGHSDRSNDCDHICRRSKADYNHLDQHHIRIGPNVLAGLCITRVSTLTLDDVKCREISVDRGDPRCFTVPRHF